MRRLIFFALMALLGPTHGIPPQECVLDVGFVLDGSGSVKLHNWRLMLSFIQEFQHLINFDPEGTRIGVVSFGNYATVNIKLNDFSDGAAFDKAVQDIPYKDENTNTASGLHALRTEVFTEANGDRPDVQNVALVLTDGKSTWQSNDTIPEASLLKEADVKIFAIGIGPKIEMDELNAIASEPSSRFVYVVANFTSLVSLQEFIVNSTCKFYTEKISEDMRLRTVDSTTTRSTTTPVTTFTTTTTTKATTTTTSPTTTSRATTTTKPTTTTTTTTTPITTTTTTTITTTTTLTATTTPATTTISTSAATTRKFLFHGGKIDVAFLLDSSGSISYGDWLLEKEFVKKIVRSVDLALDQIRVAVVYYSTEAFLSIRPGNASHINVFDAAIDSIPHIKQRTNVSGALRFAYRDVLNEKNSRSDARKVIVLITDGEPNTDKHLTKHEVDTTKSLGFHIFAVGIGNDINIDMLKQIASKPFYYFIRIVNDFSDIIKNWYQVASKVFSSNYPEETIDPNFGVCSARVVFVVDVSLSESYFVVDLVEAMYEVMLDGHSGSEILTIFTSASNPGASGNVTNVANLAKSLSLISNNVMDGKDYDPYKQQNIVVIISSKLYFDVDSLKKEVKNLKGKGVVFIVMAVDNAINDGFLQYVVSEPKNYLFTKITSWVDWKAELERYENTDSLRRYPVIANTCKISGALVWWCSFEEGDRCFMENDRRADFTWTITNRPTPSRHTGPDSAYHGQYYAFIEASSPRQYGDKATMYLPVSGENVFCLSFYYHMFGYHTGVLDVFVLADGQETILWRMSGPKGRTWIYAEVLLRLHEGDVIGIRGIRAKDFSGDIGLDLLRVRLGPCVGDI